MREKSNLHVLICEDDEIMLGVNQAFVKGYSKKFRKNIQIYLHDGLDEKLEVLIQSGAIDIAILDIDLVNGNGFMIAKKLENQNKNIPVIFITSHEEFKKDAWDVMPVGFITKPVQQEVFATIYERALRQAEGNVNKENEKFIHIMENRKEHDIRVAEIISLEKIQRKVLIKCTKGNFEVNDTLLSLEQQLLPFFLRISQGVIVNIREITHSNKKQIFMSTGDSYDIGVTYEKQVKGILRSK